MDLSRNFWKFWLWIASIETTLPYNYSFKDIFEFLKNTLTMLFINVFGNF
jgi:hypothetical protein